MMTTEHGLPAVFLQVTSNRVIKLDQKCQIWILLCNYAIKNKEMNKKQKLAFELINFVLGAFLMLASIAAIYGHLWLSEFNSIPASELATIFSENVASEKGRMEELRIFGAFGSIVLFSLTVLSANKYYDLHEDAKWEIKKGLAGGLFMFVTGIIFYFLSPDLFFEAISLTFVILGTTFTVGNVWYLMNAE